MYSNHAHIHKYRITNNFQILTSHNRKWFVPKPRDLTLCLLNYERQLSWTFVRKRESIKAVFSQTVAFWPKIRQRFISGLSAVT